MVRLRPEGFHGLMSDSMFQDLGGKALASYMFSSLGPLYLQVFKMLKFDRCIPLSAIIPPARLSANIWTSVGTQAEGVPFVNWASLSHRQVANDSGVGDTFGGVTQGTYRTATASIYDNTTLQMPAKHQNYSYTLKYQGPRLICADVTNQTFFDQLGLRAREWASRIRGV
ncbi:hypothetical protein FOVG_08357 [Fusarium oxysporum f. sp. pisi HDV247]|uniref:Uncharacterized protein n=1 Tax=Fusarium oxysporum f. sp. pisi HDV247 TaxID=1080344 RepID=W9PUK2_FUSOX|nr:hypothetical protein FOVG_08357 [Fusarium oxysporum f. sp. pisi HDV247]